MKLTALFITVSLLLVAATYWDDTPPDADLTFINRGDVFTLDPQRMSYMQDFRIGYALYEGLVRWNNHDLSIEPAAADLPQVSDDQLTYTFRIRHDARWSNGDPVTAHDFVYSWQRLIWPDTAADYSNLFFVIQGAQEFFHWRNQQLQHHVKTASIAPSGSTSAEDLFNAALDRFTQTVGIRALDDRTLQIALRQPTPYFLDLLCFVVCYPVHRPTVEGWPEAIINSDAMKDRGWIGVTDPPWTHRRLVALNPVTARLEQKHEWARPGKLVSNGPYVLAQWRYKRDLRLERNPQYHSPHIIRNDSVLMLSVEDTNTAVLAYESGKIDWLSDVGADYVADMLEQRRRYEARHADQINRFLQQGRTLDQALGLLAPPRDGERRNVHALPTFGTDFYSFNCRAMLADGRANPFADARVRRAFALAVDKAAIVRNATRLNEPIANTLIPRGSIPGYRSPAGLPHDLTQARAELAAAGWLDRNNDGQIENERGEPFPVIDLLWTTNSSRYRWMSLELKSQWESTLGVQVQLRGADTKFYKEDLKQGKFMIARGRWYGDYGDPTTFLDINKTGDGNNDRGFSSAPFDALLARAAEQRDPRARMQTLHEAERMLVEQELPLVPICQLVQTYMYEPGHLTGLTSHPRLIQYLWQIEATR